MATNINLRITANTQLGSTLAQLKAMESGMAGVQKRADQFSNNLNTTGQYSAKGWRDIKEEMADVRHHYRDVIDASGQYYGTTKNITSASTKFNEALSRQKMSLREIVTSFGTARTAMKEQMALNQMMVNSWSRDATGKMSVDMWVPKDVDLSGMKHLRQQMMYYNELLHIGSKEMINWGKNIQWAGRQLTVGFSVPISIAAGFMARFALEADEGLVRIAKVYGDTESAFQATNDSIRNMARDTAVYIADQYGIAATETRNVMAELAATGLEGPELQKMTVATQRLSLLGEMDSEDSLKLMRTMKEVYGFSSAELDKQVNYFNAIENSTALTMQDITEGLPRISGIMKATGTSITEQTELLTAFKAAGIDVAEGANALKSINFKAIAATPTAKKSFLALTGEDMDALIKKNDAEFMPMMMDIAKIMETMDNPSKMSLVQQVFGIHQGGRAITLIEQLTKGSEAMARANEVGMRSAADHAAAANKEIGTIQDSLSTRFKRIIETIKASMEEIGEPVLEVLLPIGEGISKILKGFNELSDGSKKMIVTTALVLAVFGPLVMFAGLMGNLAGMFLRMASNVIGLAGKFKILNPESHAANLIQAAMQKTLPVTTQAMIAQTAALTGLTRALTLNNQAALLAATPKMMPGSTILNGTGVSGITTKNTGKSVPIANPRQQQRDLTKMRDGWVKVGHAVNGASMAMMTLGSVTGNTTMVTISSLAMALGTLGPIAGSMSKTVAGAFMKTGGAAGTFAGKLKGMIGGLGNVGKGLLATLTGPLGLAIGAAAAISFAVWSKHKKEIQQLKTDYENLGNTGADAAAKIYGYTPVTPLEREMQNDPTGGAKTTIAQQERIKLWEADEKYGETIIRQREKLMEITDKQARSESAMAEAAAQARNVLLNGGTEEQARLAAWDWYSMLSDEWTTYSDFTAQVNIEWGDSFDEGFEGGFADAQKRLNEVMAEAQATAAKRAKGNIFTGDDLVKRMFTQEQEAQLRNRYKQVLQSALSIPDTQKQFDALNDVFGTEISTLQEVFQRGMSEGWLKEEDRNMASFLENLEDATENAELAGSFGFASKEQLQNLQIVADTLLESDKNLADLMETEEDVVGVWSGRNKLVEDYVDMQRVSFLMDRHAFEVANGKNKEAAITLALIDAQYLKGERLLKQEQDRLAVEEARTFLKDKAMTLAPIPGMENVLGLVDVAKKAGENLEDGGEAAGEAIEDGADAAQDRLADSFREAQSQASNDLADIYERQFDKAQDAERKVFDDYHDGLMEDIETEYESDLEILEAEQKHKADVLDARHKAQVEALKNERKIAEDALDDANKAANKRLDARADAAAEAEKAESKALADRYEALEKQMDDRHEAERERIERTFDLQVEKIEAQIEEEERLEEIRQEMYEAEKERISRLQEMFSSNIDLNMAVNSGDMDEAARIASEMSAQQAGWATDDLSDISGDASDDRKERMSAEIDRINERKEARLEALDEIEEAEKEALAAQEEREQAALEAKYVRIDEEINAEREKLAELHELNRQALEDDFTLREASLAERQQKASETQDAIFADEKETLQETRDEAKAIQTEATENARVLNEERLEDAKTSFTRQLDGWRGMLATSGAEFNTLNQDMAADLRNTHLPNIETANDASVQRIWTNAKKTQDRKLKQLENDAAFSEFAQKLTRDMVKAIYGDDMSLAEFRKFVKTGELPDPPKRGSTDVNRYGNVVRHSGGVIGEGAAYSKYNSRTGPGFSKAKEVQMTGLEGEGVLNLRAMGTPGVPQLMNALNSGKRPHSMVAQHDLPGGNRAGGSTGLGRAGIQSVIPLLMRRISESAVLAGMEIGVAKAESRLSPVDIKLGAEQREGLTDEQIRNASAIVTTGRQMGASERDILTALMTAMQESTLRNLGYGDDIYGVTNPDGTPTSSLGLFQQQKWWGTRSERLDPYKSSELFYKALFQIGDRKDMSLTAAAQAVQGSAYPNAYAKWESLARVLLGGASADMGQITRPGDPNKERISELRERLESVKEMDRGFMFPTTGMVSWLYGWRDMFASGPDMHNAIDIRAPGGTPVYASAGGKVKAGWDSSGGGNYIQLDHGNGLWTNYLHLSRKIAASGETVRRGERIGDVGNTGSMSLGNHLHFMVGKGGPWAHVDPNPYLPRRVKVGDYVAPGIGMQDGGWVGGNGIGDTESRMLASKEFVVKRRVATRHGDFLEALNNEQIDLMPVSANMSPAATGTNGKSIDSSNNVTYNIGIKTGPVNSDVDITRAVEKAVKGIERKKSHNRRIT